MLFLNMLYEVPTYCYVLFMSVHIYPAKSSAQLSVRVYFLSSTGIVVFNVLIE